MNLPLETQLESPNATINSELTAIHAKAPKDQRKGVVFVKSHMKQGNLIKKVKTYTIHVYEKLLQSCLIAKHSFRLYNISNKRRRRLFQSFKSDISRRRTSQVLSLEMREIFIHFTGIDLSDLRVKKTKQELFNFLSNSSFEVIMKMLQRHCF